MSGSPTSSLPSVGLGWRLAARALHAWTLRRGRRSGATKGHEAATVVFVAHRVEEWNVLLDDHARYGFLHTNPARHLDLGPDERARARRIARGWRFNLLRSFDVCDSFDIRTVPPMRAHTVVLRNIGVDFSTAGPLGKLWGLIYVLGVIRLRILHAVLYAQNVLGADVVGLGALTKDQSLTKGGAWILAALRPYLHVKSLCHGDSFTAAALMKGVEKAIGIGRVGPGDKIVITGPTSKTGNPIVRRLVQQGFDVVAVTRSPERFQGIVDHLERGGVATDRLRRADSLDDPVCRGAALGITLKAIPFGDASVAAWNAIDTDDRLIVINGAVPDPNELRAMPQARFKHIDGALITFSRSEVQMRFMMRLMANNERGLMYSCWAGAVLWTYLLAAGSDEHRAQVGHEVGPVSLARALSLWDIAQEYLDFQVPPLTTHLTLPSWSDEALGLLHPERVRQDGPRIEAQLAAESVAFPLP